VVEEALLGAKLGNVVRKKILKVVGNVMSLKPVKN
jgi:hypothetical protein